MESRRRFLQGAALLGTGVATGAFGNKLVPGPIPGFDFDYELAACLDLARRVIAFGIDKDGSYNPTYRPEVMAHLQSDIPVLTEKLLELHKKDPSYAKAISGHLVSSLKSLGDACESDDKALAAAAFNYKGREYPEVPMPAEEEKCLAEVRAHRGEILSLVQESIGQTLVALRGLDLSVPTSNLARF